MKSGIKLISVFAIILGAIAAVIVFVSIQTGTEVDTSSNGKFDDPAGATIDKNGFVYVADPSVNRIQKFDSQGHFVAVWSSHGEGRLASDSQGNIYGINGDSQQARKYLSDGTVVMVFGPAPTGPTTEGVMDGIAIDPTGNVFVTNSAREEIKEYNSNGALIARWPSKVPEGNGTLTVPRSLAFDSNGFLYVRGGFDKSLDVGSSIVYKYKIIGHERDCGAPQYKVADNVCYVASWSSGDGYGFGMVVDSKGNVYVEQSEIIREFTTDGKLVKSFCDFPLCESVKDLAIDRSDNLYAVLGISGHERVEKITIDGKSVLTIGSPLYPGHP